MSKTFSKITPKVMKVILAFIMICGVCLPLFANPKTAQAADVPITALGKDGLFNNCRYVAMSGAAQEVSDIQATGGTVNASTPYVDWVAANPGVLPNPYETWLLGSGGSGSATASINGQDKTSNFIFTSNNTFEAAAGSSVSMTYKNMGFLKDTSDSSVNVPLDCKVTITLQSTYPVGKSKCSVSDYYDADGRAVISFDHVFSDGFLLIGMYTANVNYEFFNAGTTEKADIDNIVYTQASNQAGEGVTIFNDVSQMYVSNDALLSADMLSGSQYKTIAGSYLYDKTSDSSLNTGDSPTLIGCPNVYDTWGSELEADDTYTDYDFYWRSGSFALTPIDGNKIETRIYSMANPTDNWTGTPGTNYNGTYYYGGGYWFVPTFFPLINVTPPAPVKDVSVENVVAGDDVTFTVSQHLDSVIASGNDSSAASMPYSSVIFQDTLDKNVDYNSAKVLAPNNDDITNMGNLKYDAATHKVTFEFSKSALQNYVAMNGGEYQFVIDTTVNSDASETIENTPLSIINDVTITGDPVDVGILTCEKTSDPITGTTVSAGDEITYHLNLALTDSDADAENVAVRDYIPEHTTYVAGSATEGGTYDATNDCVNWNFATLVAGSEKTVDFTVVVDDDVITGTEIRNVALYEPNHDPDDTTDPKNETNETIHPAESVIPGDKVTVYKSSNPVTGTVVSANEEIQYTLTAVNTGESVSTNTIIRDVIPEGTTYVAGSAEKTNGAYNADGNYVEWCVSALQPTESIDVSFSVTVNQETVTAGDRVLNVAQYGDTDTPVTPGDPTNPTPTEPTNITIHPTDPDDMVPAVVQVIKSSEPVPGSTVQTNDTITYSLTVKNVGGANASDAKDVYVLDYIPEGTVYVDGSVSSDNSGTFDATKNAVSWTIPTLAVNEEVTLNFIVKVTADNDSVIENQALYEPNHDPNNPNDPENESNIVAHPLQPTPQTPSVNNPLPKTGDNLAPFWLLFGILVVAITTCAVCGVHYARKRKDSDTTE